MEKLREEIGHKIGKLKVSWNCGPFPYSGWQFSNKEEVVESILNSSTFRELVEKAEKLDRIRGVDLPDIASQREVPDCYDNDCYFAQTGLDKIRKHNLCSICPKEWKDEEAIATFSEVPDGN